jgi:Domain of unknown function (DUF4383)
MLLHLPVNHRYRPTYRFLAGLAGLYVLVFGIVGVVVSRGHGAFARGPIVALGLPTNLAFSILSIAVGVVALLGVGLGHNYDFYLEIVGGVAFLVVGFLMLAVMETPLNIFNFTVAKCVVSFVIGLVLFTAGLYSRTGTSQEVDAEERHRHVPPGAPQPAHPTSRR